MSGVDCASLHFMDLQLVAISAQHGGSVQMMGQHRMTVKNRHTRCAGPHAQVHSVSDSQGSVTWIVFPLVSEDRGLAP